VVFVVYMVNLKTGQMYTACNSTTGWRMAYEALVEAVTVKRMLHGGARLLPLVDLQSRPFKTGFGMRSRPHLQILDDWRSAGGTPLPATGSTPQLSGPTPVLAAPAPKTVKETLDTFASGTPEAAHPAAAATNLTDPPKAVSSEEFFDDSIPWK
jgi:hypothetical protein